MYEVFIQCSKQYLGSFQQKSVTMHSQDSIHLCRALMQVYAGSGCRGVFYSEVLGIVYKGDYIVYCTAIMTS